MIYTIGTQTLEITDAESEERKGSPNQIVGWKDVAETCRTLDAVCKVIKDTDHLHCVDGIARSGFWGAVFRNRWPDCTVHFNEQDVTCKEVLKRNFPQDKITTYDIKEWAPKQCDLSLIDFDHFTLRILDEWKDTLIRWNAATSKYFIIADGACFGFKFGNMKHYGIKTDEEYYFKLDEALSTFLNRKITVVSKFSNAATILLEPRRRGSIKFVPPSSDLIVSRDYVKTLF